MVRKGSVPKVSDIPGAKDDIRFQEARMKRQIAENVYRVGKIYWELKKFHGGE